MKSYISIFCVGLSLSQLIGLALTGPPPPLKLPDLVKAGLQYDAFIDGDSSSAVDNNIFSSGKPGLGENAIYTVGFAVGRLGTGAVFSAYSASNEPSVDRFVPDHGVPDSPLLESVLTYNLTSPDDGFFTAFARTNQTKPAIKKFAKDDPLVKTICDGASAATRALEQRRGALQKTLFIVEKDQPLTDGTMGEMMLTFESLGSPVADVLTQRCTSWTGDLIAWNTNYTDMSVVSGWKVVSKGAQIVRLGLQINPKLSH